ncbi:AI-2E family transporter [Aurantiacibacter marinus]|uniref:Permease n=1 Tax=Aurantiacibacter marinus TaxID=874156 RepID=A0A0H0XLU1_9SPHN|nr:AI-2E family transporter [Aurantiacibacter marinus]KLI62912.1 hypothetical protein AAV99_12675 [Aurantiacibacter marinus]
MNEHSPLPPDFSRALLALFVLGGIVLCYLIAEPFFAALVWSATLAVLFAGFERKMRLRLRSTTLSVVLTMILITVLVVVPVLLVSRAVLDAVLSGVADAEGLLSVDWRNAANGMPGWQTAVAWIDANLDIVDLADSFAAAMQQLATDLLVGSLTSAITLLLTFYFLFYFLRDSDDALSAIGLLIPLSDSEYAKLLTRMTDTIFATVWGIAIVSMVQGLLGGLMFWWLDLPSPVFWGLVMGLLAIVPFLGAFVVWLPAAILLVLDGQWSAALILTVWGTLIVGLIDNVLYPMLVGRQLAQHSVIAFIAIIGGIAVFGAHGFILGPLVISATLTLLEILRTRLDRREAAIAAGEEPPPRAGRT